jgi:hypothetical protein
MSFRPRIFPVAASTHSEGADAIVGGDLHRHGLSHTEQGPLMADSHGEIIPKMDCWSALDDRRQVATGAAHPPPGTGDGPRAMPAFDLRTSTWLKKTDGASLPAASPGTDGADGFSWIAAIMIWGGPASPWAASTCSRLTWAGCENRGWTAGKILPGPRAQLAIGRRPMASGVANDQRLSGTFLRAHSALFPPAHVSH